MEGWLQVNEQHADQLRALLQEAHKIFVREGFGRMTCGQLDEYTLMDWRPSSGFCVVTVSGRSIGVDHMNTRALAHAASRLDDLYAKGKAEIAEREEAARVAAQAAESARAKALDFVKRHRGSK